MPASLTAVARHLLFVRETDGPNRGAWVSFFQRFCGGVDGDSWCSDFVSVVCDIAYHGRSPLVRSGSSQARLLAARAKGFIVTVPAVDDLYYFVGPDGHAHHEGIVTEVRPLTGIAGNTSVDGTSRNGTGVFEHGLTARAPQVVFARLPKEP
jgi:hypothetical protein